MTTRMLYAWRHPRILEAAGRCVGRIDLQVDPRRCRRLARRIERVARRAGLPRIVLTSPLARCRDVGRCLARLGWRHEVRAELLELDFGTWDGLRWEEVPRDELDAWAADFVGYRPGGGESVEGMLCRVAAFVPGEAQVIVTHGGWLAAASWVSTRGTERPESAQWPAPPPPGRGVRLEGARRHALAEGAWSGDDVIRRRGIDGASAGGRASAQSPRLPGRSAML